MSSDEWATVEEIRAEKQRETDPEQASEAAAEHDRGRLTNQRTMQRVTLRMPESMVDDIDEQVNRGLYPNRSEAIRAGVRREIMLADGGER